MYDFLGKNSVEDLFKTAKEEKDSKEDLNGLFQDITDKLFELAYIFQNYMK